MNVIVKSIVVTCCFLTTSNSWAVPTLFFDDFQSGNLDQWVGPDGPDGQSSGGTLSTDPLNPENTVLAFNRLWYGGDAFTRIQIDLSNVTSPILSFDYLGLAEPGSVAGDLGGFLGIATQYSLMDDASKDGTVAYWLFGTRPYGSQYGAGFGTQQLIDDGQWHSYSIDLSRYVDERGMTSVYIMIEDFVSSRGVAGDAYFDNIRLSAVSVPEPSTLALFCLGFLGLGFAEFRASQLTAK